VEAAGKGIDSGETAATLAIGTPGVIHGSRTVIMQNDDGQISEPYSISAGLDYPGIGPLFAWLYKTQRVVFEYVTDNEALAAAFLLTRLEGIIPALEPAHALALLGKLTFKPHDIIVITLSGRGDKDMAAYVKYMEEQKY
jgi:tryptophan synthase beta chain